MTTAGNIFKIFLRGLFHLLYHELAWAYDGIAWIVSSGMWNTWILSVVPFLLGSRILELGHGPGHLQAELLSKGIWSCGIDESWWMSKIAIKRCRNLINGIAQTLPFANGSFSQVVVTFPSEYIYSERTLSEVFRVLEPGGHLVILPMAWITGKNLYQRFTGWLFYHTGQTEKKDLDIIYQKFSSLVGAVGFHVDIKTKVICDTEVLIVIATKSRF